MGRAIFGALEKAGHPLTEAEIEPLIEVRTHLKRRALRALVFRVNIRPVPRPGDDEYAPLCLGSGTNAGPRRTGLHGYRRRLALVLAGWRGLTL